MSTKPVADIGITTRTPTPLLGRVCQAVHSTPETLDEKAIPASFAATKSADIIKHRSSYHHLHQSIAHKNSIYRARVPTGISAVDMFDSVLAGKTLLADRAHNSNALREWLADRGAWGKICAMPNHLQAPVFSPYLYQLLNAVDLFSTNSNTFAPSPRATTNRMTTFSLPLSSLHCEYGQDLMVRWPRMKFRWGGEA